MTDQDAKPVTDEWVASYKEYLLQMGGALSPTEAHLVDVIARIEADAEKINKLEHQHLLPDGNWILVVKDGKVVFKQAATHNLWAGDTVNLTFEFVPI